MLEWVIPVTAGIAAAAMITAAEAAAAMTAAEAAATMTAAATASCLCRGRSKKRQRSNRHSRRREIEFTHDIVP